MIEKDPLTVAEAAILAGVSVRTVRRYISDGLLTPETVRGRSGDEHRLRREEVLRVRSSRKEAIEVARTSPTGKMAEELEALRRVIETQTGMIEEQRRTIGDLQAEQKDTRHQLHQLHETLLALPMRTQEPRPSLWRRIFGPRTVA